MRQRNWFYLSSWILLPSIAIAQDYGAILQQQLQQDNALSAQMQQYQNNIVQQNMNNPQVQQMYQNYLANGGTGDFATFSYNYAATAGFTPDGINRYNQNERAIQQQENNAIQQYRQSQAQNAEAMQQMRNHQDDIARQRGNLLNGTTDYIDPSTGMRHNLPHTTAPDSYYQDRGTGQTYYNNPQGNYSRETTGGYWQDLEEED